MDVMRLGILGGGQLGRMLALAAYPLGIRTTVLDPTPDPCAAQVCDHIHGEFDDFQALYKLAQASDVITYEFENVPVATAEWLNERVPVYPPPRALKVSQDRITEKDFFTELGIPTPTYAAIDSREDFDAAIRKVGLPSVLKTRRFGYDGKGQMVLRTASDVEIAWATFGGRPLILEAFVPFDRELSLVCVRSTTGETRFYSLVENEHRDGTLFKTLAPAPRLTPQLQQHAEVLARKLLDLMKYVGVLAIEWFEKDGQLFANEMAPRVHNSGHWTQDGAVTSQFKNHVRAVMGLPLGDCSAIGHSAMLNLLGTAPPFAEILAIPEAKLHWYGKDPKPRRKLGHVNLRCETASDRDQLLSKLRNCLNLK
ncbi:5-(carboxyamino)imidazole ribonucleotide synthase [soil metagenome]